jgi:hypothetical protein
VLRHVASVTYGAQARGHCYLRCQIIWTLFSYGAEAPWAVLFTALSYMDSDTYDSEAHRVTLVLRHMDIGNFTVRVTYSDITSALT